MAQEFDGPVVVKGKLEAKTVRVNGVQIKGEVKALLINVGQVNAGLVDSKIVACDHLHVRGTPQAPGTPAALFEPSSPADPAAQFKGHVGVEGNLDVLGDIRLLNADCAEDFDIAEADSIEPGTVMVLGEQGALYQSTRAYDKRVAGVVSGAGDYKPGIVLDKQQSVINRKPIALLGKVYCKVDSSHAPIEIGDLLTTSDTPGHAMKATDQLKAFGAVIGKALAPVKEGQGLVPILIALH